MPKEPPNYDNLDLVPAPWGEFGDAEWIGVLSVEDNKGQILPDEQGAIDMPKVQALAADILEGGKSAFNQRREKYGFN